MKSASFFSKFAKGEGALKVGVKCKSRLNSNCNLCRYGEILPQMDNFLSFSHWKKIPQVEDETKQSSADFPQALH